MKWYFSTSLSSWEVGFICLISWQCLFSHNQYSWQCVDAKYWSNRQYHIGCYKGLSRMILRRISYLNFDCVNFLSSFVATFWRWLDTRPEKGKTYKERAGAESGPWATKEQTTIAWQKAQCFSQPRLRCSSRKESLVQSSVRFWRCSRRGRCWASDHVSRFIGFLSALV